MHYRMINAALAFVVVLMAVVSADAGTWRDIGISCRRVSKTAQGFHWLEDCMANIFTAQPHPALNTIAPGTGFAFGGGYSLEKRWDRTEMLPSALIVRSTDGSTLGRVSTTFAIPAWSFGILNDSNEATDEEDRTAEASDNGYHDSRTRMRPPHYHAAPHLALIRDYWKIDSKLSFTFSAEGMNLRHQDFYGIGEQTTQSGLARYGIRQQDLGIAVNDPITTWAEAGLAVKGIWSHPRGVSSADRPAIDQVYAGTSVTALGVKTTILEISPYVRFRLPITNRYLRRTEFKVGYSFDHDVDNAGFSFRRLKADARTEQDIRVPVKTSSRNRSQTRWGRFLNLACPNIRAQTHCLAGTVVVDAEVSAAYTESGNHVPFYFNETLGGTDIAGNDTLRGFRDYRFNGPSRMFLQAEYRHRVWGPFNFITFYDVGRVAVLPSDLEFRHLKHDFGIGFNVTASDHVVLRAFVGFGTREGILPHVKAASAF